MYVDHLTMGPGLQDLVSTPKEKTLARLVFALFCLGLKSVQLPLRGNQR